MIDFVFTINWLRESLLHTLVASIGSCGDDLIPTQIGSLRLRLFKSAVVFFRCLSHNIGVLGPRAGDPIPEQPGSLHHRAVGVIKGFLLKELPTRGHFVGARVSGKARIAMSGGDGGEQSMSGLKRGKAKADGPGASSRSAPRMQQIRGETSGKELVLHGSWKPEMPVEEEDVLEFDLDEEAA
jgi:hypothetical protein